MSQPLSFQSRHSDEEWSLVSHQRHRNSFQPPKRTERSVEEITKDLAQTHLEEKKEPFSSKEKSVPFHVVRNVHQDDIHCCLSLPDQTFISGSKDGSLKKWDQRGKLLCNVYLPEKVNYLSWITALAPLGEGHWISGTRDGYVDYWDIRGIFQKNLQAPVSLDSNQPKCKARNIQRVNCLSDLTPFTPNDPTFSAGRPTRFSIHSLKDGQREGYCKTSANDWVYCVHPLKGDTFLVVTGENLAIWKKLSFNFSRWSKDPLIEIPYKKPAFVGEVRPFISAVTPLGQASFGLAVFDGSVRIYDIARKTLVSKTVEHKHRVWTIERIRPNLIASCGDDGFIKLWDLRQMEQSIVTLQDNREEKARVSVLLSSDDESTLMSGSCPDDVRSSKEKARFSFWDVRKV